MSAEKTPERRISGALTNTNRGRESAYASHHLMAALSLPTGQAVRHCPTCGADSSAIEWRDMRHEPNEFAHAIPGRMAPFCSRCDRPWFRGSRDTRLWTGATS